MDKLIGLYNLWPSHAPQIYLSNAILILGHEGRYLIAKYALVRVKTRQKASQIIKETVYKKTIRVTFVKVI